MVSVLVYVRNDAYSYNLPKRAAISLNCIAEVLSHVDDEIIFVDCNTPEGLPTFPESIQDTLTPKTKEILRVLRLRTHLYRKYAKGSPLNTLEPLCRNIAIRRHNPANRWILSTNTDMVFVIRDQQKSLSDIAAQLPNGFYELPRFEVPEALWETVARTSPAEIIQAFRRWGKRLHLNEVVESNPFIRFDGPGDFQLMLREHIYAIAGFNEEMVWGWHVDSNLCKRLYLLNGKTESLLEHIFGYHCMHTLQPASQHGTTRTQNDPDKFIDNVTSPFIPEQADTWGIPHERIEEIKLTDQRRKHFYVSLEDILPGSPEEMTWHIFTPETFNQCLSYDTLHVLPFLANCLATISPQANVGYCGGNMELLRLMTQFLQRCGHRARVLVGTELISTACSFEQMELPKPCELADKALLVTESDVFIFDNGIMHLPPGNASAQSSPDKLDRSISNFNKKLEEAFFSCINAEIDRLRPGTVAPRMFIFVNSGHTWFEQLTLQYIGIVFSPHSTRIRHGYLLPSLSTHSKTRIKSTEKVVCYGFKYRNIIKRIPVLNFIAKRIYARLLRRH